MLCSFQFNHITRFKICLQKKRPPKRRSFLS
nr:MAG TPA: hypothetical protein [Caudoviricetes sp.]